jgi:hypothetical protein
MYNNKLAVAIKSDGKVLREVKDKVFIPFGSEYSFFIKNLNTTKADVKIFIDGESIAGDDSFVVHPGKSINIERFLRNGNMNAGNRFKFIERTGAVENHRGIGIEDGLIRVEFQFEKALPVIRHMWDPSNGPIYTKTTTKMWGDGLDCRGGGQSDILRSRRMSYGSETGHNPQMYNSVTTSSTSVTTQSLQNETGFTTEGSISEQQFTTVPSFVLEDEKHVMVLHLLGQTEDNKPVTKPITTKTKMNCPGCARVVRPNDKFCSCCGFSLQVQVQGSCKTCGSPHDGGQFCVECGTARTII